MTHAGRSRHNRAGIAIHRPRRLHQEDRAVRDGIPVTSVARTLLDLGQRSSKQQLRRAVDEAERLELFDLSAMQRLIDRSRGHRGVRVLNAVLRDYTGPPPSTRSELERRFLDLCRDADLPRPQANVLVVGQEVDVVWPDQRLVVELDGRAYHHTRAAFERDRRRDATLQLGGYAVVRVTHQRLVREPADVLAMLRALLSPSPERPGGAPGAGVPAHPAGPAC